MPRSHELYYEDILESCRRIETYTKGLTNNQFSSNQLIIDAVIRNLEIIGEATKQLPDHEKQKYPFITWKEIAGLRNVIIHAYFGININIVWNIITAEIPKLKKNMEKILKK